MRCLLIIIFSIFACLGTFQLTGMEMPAVAAAPPRVLVDDVFFVLEGFASPGCARVQVASDIINSVAVPEKAAAEICSAEPPKVQTAEKKQHKANHLVRSRDGFHFKLNNESVPLQPGMEFAVYSLYSALFPDLGLINSSCLLMFQPLTAAEKIVQASPTVGGESLEEFIKSVQQGKASFLELDENSVSAHICCSILANPSDGKPGNFMVEKRGQKKFIVGIDNDMAFASPIEQVKCGSDAQLHHVGVKNTIYFLRSLMERPIAQGIRENSSA